MDVIQDTPETVGQQEDWGDVLADFGPHCPLCRKVLVDLPDIEEGKHWWCVWGSETEEGGGC